MKPILIASVALLAAWTAVPATASDSLKCGSRLASLGDTKAEVLLKCGAPVWQDDWTQQIDSIDDGLVRQRIDTQRERWIYDFGPNSFMRFLLFENGRLVEIATGDRGYGQGHAGGGRCDAGEFRVGRTQYELLQRCGAPLFKDSRVEEQLLSLDKHRREKRVNRIDEWTYNLGPTQFLRILRFENGRLVAVETGDRGF